MTPAMCLRATLTAMSGPELIALGTEAGIEWRLICRAWNGTPINADAHLKLCAVLGVDPVDGLPRSAGPVGPIHWPSLSAAVRIARFQRKWSLRRASKAARVSYSALGRIERGEIVSIESVLAVCKFLGRHPFEFTSPVSRESTETRSAA